jgi:hypothetical protein
VQGVYNASVYAGFSGETAGGIASYSDVAFSSLLFAGAAKMPLGNPEPVVAADAITAISGKGLKKTSSVPDGIGVYKWTDPKKLNFSQRTVTENNYQKLMEEGKWIWSLDDPLIVIDRGNGVWVSLDNRRLNAAVLSNQESVPIVILKPTDGYLDYKTYRTAEEAFQIRQAHPNTIKFGGVLPPEGTSNLPVILQKSK